MKIHKLTFAMLLFAAPFAAMSDSCLESDEFYEAYCNELAYGMRVKLRVLGSLRTNAEKEAKEAITWLEHAIEIDQASINAFAPKVACSTDKVKKAMQEADQYFANYGK